MPMKLRRCLLAALLLAQGSLGCAEPRGSGRVDPDVTGTYRSVSESEWQLDLTLTRDGKAVIRLETWDAGSPNRSVKTTSATWRLEKQNVIAVEYDQITDRLKFSNETSLSSIGESGSSVGLTSIPPVPAGSKIGNVILWRLPHTFTSCCASLCHRSFSHPSGRRNLNFYDRFPVLSS